MIEIDTMPPTKTARPDPAAEAEAQVKLLADQLADARGTLETLAEFPNPAGAQNWRHTAETMRLWARRCLNRLDGG